MGVKAGKAGILAGPLAAPSPGGTPDYFGPYANWAYTPTTLRKFVDTLPGLGPTHANNRGQYIPIATPMDAAAAGVPADGDYYEIGLTQYTMKLHQDLPPTTLRGYKDLNPAGDGSSQYLGPLIIAQKNRPVRVKFSNLLTPNSSFFLPVDTTVMGAGDGPTGNPYSVNRATLHLHGGNTPWISDGTPHQWTVPAGESTAYPKGVSTQNVPDMPVPGDGQMTFYYSNQQSGRLLFYHDHAYGITRLNVYAGEAAGYLITDPAEDALIFNGTAGVIPNNGGGVYTYGIPLIIQDKTFVDASKIALQDPTWNWGTNPPTPNTGDLWLPHVYMPNQNPYDDSGAAAMGRWDYGPWFWPVFPPVNGEIPNPYFGTSPVEPPTIPGTPNPSIVPEAFMDTPIVNGTAYPTVTVEPKAYRFRILNACNDRFLNLQLYKADPAVTTSDLRTNTEVRMIAAVTGPTIPPYWPTMDGRDGGVPDPLLAGPNMIQIGTESGFLPAPVELPNTPIGYNYNRRDIVVLNVQEKTLFLGPAERADVIVDFSAFAGKTLILYNDAPAPVPAFDPRNDYYTDNGDQTEMGGAPSTVAGFGPNTRTIMQIVVGPSTTDPFTFSLPALQAALPAAYAASQHAPIVPEAAYGPAYGTTYKNNYVRIQNTSFSFAPDTLTPPTVMPLEPKAIQELFENDYGRMNATLGVERPNTNATIQTTIPYGYIDPPTELLKDGEPQIWKITHNGVDTHAIHFHLFDVQLINRVGWDGAVRPPDANELGWKETVKMNPLEDAIVALRPQKQANLPWPLPNSIRPMDVTRPIGSDMGFFGVNPDGNPVTVLNQMINFGWEYVWHCHLLGHEENDMMRPNLLAVPPEAPSNLVGVKNPNGSRIDLSWTDNSMGETGFTIQRSPDDTFTSVSEISLGPNVTTYTDTGLDPNATYFWRVYANNLVGDINTLGFPILQANSLPSAAIGFNSGGTITITVTAPNGGESWVTKTSRSVTWTQTGLTGMASIDLYKGGAFLKTLGTADITLGTFTWAIGVTETAGIDYRIRVGQGGMWDESNANFAIVQTAVRTDFNGDGQDDILWRHYAAGGNNLAWFLGNTGPVPLPLQMANRQGAIPSASPLDRNRTPGRGAVSLRDMGISRNPNEKSGLTSSQQEALAAMVKQGATMSAVNDPRRAGGMTGKSGVLRSPLGYSDPRQVALAAKSQAPGGNLAKIAAASYLGTGDIMPVADLNWEIKGTGDFNKDGQVDILWRYNGPGGFNVVWFMNGTNWVSSAELLPFSDLTWQIVGTGDFNRDGNIDILWRNGISGNNLVWYMNGTNWAGSAALLGVSDPNWTIVGTGDFNKDGNVDILWRFNGAGGYDYIWYMNGVNWIGGGDLLPVTDLNWQIVGTGDYNVDGSVDILWRYNGAGGFNVIWYLTGTTWIGNADLLAVPDLAWKIVGR
jgi:FtsP/CotA-like multicopper oxidase with cupredoxin domain